MTVTRVSFVAGERGEWTIESVRAVIGETLAGAPRLARREGDAFHSDRGAWAIDGVRSNDRYVTRAEKTRLVEASPPLGRAEANCAALIPIRKSDAWWALTQDERRAIFEEQSRHIAIGLEYVPAVARRLYHCRDLGEPWDFLTWFEFADRDRDAFDRLVEKLRATEEWRYVDREVDIRLVRQ
jgi:hypothetical protein